MARVLLLAVVVVLVSAGGAALVAAGGLLPRGTGAPTLAGRGALGLVIGAVIVFFVWRMMRALGDPPPPSPPTVEARGADVVYECPVCGTRLRLEIAATTKAPKHCGEEMEAKIG